MTNAGLYISLPMSSITWHTDDRFFAFLACRTKRHYGLVAVCLQQRSWARFASFFRVASNRRSPFHFEQPTGRLFRTPSVEIQNYWVSRRARDDEISVIAWKEGLKGVHFDVLVKGAKPYDQVPNSDRSEVSTKQRNPDDKLNFSIRHRTPNAIRAHKAFHESKLPMQHRITGFFEPSRFQHEPITFTDSSLSFTLAFTQVEQSIWLYMTDTESMHPISTSVESRPEDRSIIASFSRGLRSSVAYSGTNEVRTDRYYLKHSEHSRTSTSAVTLMSKLRWIPTAEEHFAFAFSLYTMNIGPYPAHRIPG
ncbi:hypothetical protein T440DRAFT_273960 [Plenodomus tracheiphilus IPT5]|uniref:Uncharacterized protein n=1 Tax=Plenodomus tracheiphilus IPT5 TaxID=1408161 RepID=A0A6A7BG05_9PLEO|nr:hypothetical protein T440DRAFT_273960 [Plenodomus tracheiphilus IPT5]